jgi:sugar-specific transcriptional regulator TrmB/DNA-binding CsgD family transcriptional regulator
MLRAVGVSEFDEQVYRALLRNPDITPADVAAGLGATVRRVNAALIRLTEVGLVRRDGGYTPNNPETALTALLRRRETELDTIRNTMPDLAQDYRAGSLTAHRAQLVELVTGVDEIAGRSIEVYQSAQREVLAFERPPYAVPRDFDEVATEAPILERGVSLRVIYSAEALEADGKLDIVRALVALGEQARTLPDLPLKLVIVDRRVARVSLTTDAYATEMVAVIHTSGLLDALVALFEAYWQRAHPVGATVTEPVELSADEARVLGMLGAGFKDESIARHLGASMRTTGRRVSSIMDVLGASTRFQAGAQAVRRGWL